MLRVKDDEHSSYRDTPEPSSLAGSLSDDELPLDPDLYQELCAGGGFDDHNLVMTLSYGATEALGRLAAS